MKKKHEHEKGGTLPELDRPGDSIHGIVRRLNNVRGQLEGVTRMMSEQDDCIAILTQLKAARAGLERATTLFLEENLKLCLGVERLSPKKRSDIENILAELSS